MELFFNHICIIAGKSLLTVASGERKYCGLFKFPCWIAEIDLYYYAQDEPQRNSNAINQHTNQHCITFEGNGSLLLWRQLILFNEAEDFIIEKRQLWDIRVPGCGQVSSNCRFITNLTKSKSSEVRQVPVWSHPSTSALHKLGLNLQMPGGICLLHILHFAGIITEKERKSYSPKNRIFELGSQLGKFLSNIRR